MPRILLYDIGHVENFGDKLVHEVVCATLGSRVPALEVVRLTSVRTEAPIPGFHQLSKADWVGLANQCDLALVLGGSIFFNDRLLAMDRTYLEELCVPLVIWGGVQDPRWLETEAGQETVKSLAAAATQAFHRFPGETEVLRGLVPEAKLVLGGDPGLLLPIGQPKKPDRVVFALSRFLLQRLPAVAQSLPRLCRALAQQHELVAVWCESADANHFRDLLPGVNNVFGYAHVLTTLRNCAGVVGCRLHPLVLGASQRVPLVGWEIGSRKIRWCLEALGAESALIDLSGGASPSDIERTASLVEAWPVDADDYACRTAELAAAAREALDWIADTLR